MQYIASNSNACESEREHINLEISDLFQAFCTIPEVNKS